METTPLRAGDAPRAFNVLTDAPAGCRLLQVLNDFAEPHLRVGEFAVVAPIAAGERLADGLAVARRMLSGQHQFWALRRYPAGRGPFGPLTGEWAQRDEIVFGLNPLLRNSEDAISRWRAGEDVKIRCSDGWLAESDLRPSLIGKVIGVLPLPLGMSAPAAARIARGGAA